MSGQMHCCMNKQAREMIPDDIGRELKATFNSEDFEIVNTR